MKVIFSDTALHYHAVNVQKQFRALQYLCQKTLFLRQTMYFNSWLHRKVYPIWFSHSSWLI